MFFPAMYFLDDVFRKKKFYQAYIQMNFVVASYIVFFVLCDVFYLYPLCPKYLFVRNAPI
jgi:hypothetical protein